jgi:hypothetical protein
VGIRDDIEPSPPTLDFKEWREPRMGLAMIGSSRDRAGGLKKLDPNDISELGMVNLKGLAGGKVKPKRQERALSK